MNEVRPTQKDRRQSPRLACSASVWLSWAQNNDIRGECWEVCRKGLRIAIMHAIPNSVVVALRSDALGLQGNGVVRYCRQHGLRYDIGVEFVGELEWSTPGQRGPAFAARILDVLHAPELSKRTLYPRKPWAFRSQYGEDRWIAENIVLPETGVFVELGSDDGIVCSNTYYFEQRGWAGLLIEPNPDVQEMLHRNRRCAIMQCAIGNADEPKPYFVHPCPSNSGFNRGGRQVVVEVKRLDTALTEAGITQIDLLSLDTEGSELEIWNTFDHRKWNPRIVIIEFNTAGLPSKEAETKHVFETCQYELIHKTNANLIFRTSEGLLSSD